MITKLIQLTVITVIVSAKIDPVCKMEANMDPESCCKVPDILDHPTLEKCTLRLFDTKAKSNSSSEVNVERSGQCLFDCIFKEHGILKNNTILTDVALNLLKEVIQEDPVWMPIVANAISACKVLAANQTKTTEVATCNPEPAFYFGCFHTQLFKNCPSTKWTSSDGCNQLKQNAEKCPVLTAVIRMD